MSAVGITRVFECCGYRLILKVYTQTRKTVFKKKTFGKFGLRNFIFFLGDEVLNLLWTLLCSAVIIRSRQYQYKMQHVCKWAIIDMNNLSRLLCCRVEEDQLLYVEGDFFPFSVLPNIDGCYFLTEFFPLWCDYLRYFSYRISCILHIVVIKGGEKMYSNGVKRYRWSAN